MSNQITFSKKLDLLQVYRGLAAVFVLFFHGSQILRNEFHQQDILLNIGNLGWVGVDFFFVLSGFIIFYIHQSDIGQPNRLKSFILKRLVRIYPFYWIVLSLKIGSLIVTGSEEIGDSLNFIEISKNILLYPQEYRLIDVSWTLSHEVLFYIMFGIMLVLGYKWFWPIGAVWLIGILLNLAGIFADFKDNILILKFILHENNIEFLIGCLVAYLVVKNKTFFKYGLILNCIATFLLTLYFILYQSQIIDPQQVTRVIWAIPFAILILGSVGLEMTKDMKIPSILIYIGNASYSLYLIHGFVVSNVAKIISKINLGLVTSHPLVTNTVALLIFMITVGVGCAVYSYIEKPVLNICRAKLLTRKAEVKAD